MKTKQHSTKPKRVTKAQARREMDSEIEINSFSKREWPIPKERIITYGKDLLLMFEQDEEMISELAWRKKFKLTRNKVNHYIKTHPEFKEMIKEFKDLVGIRAFEKGFYRKADSNFAAKAMGMYNADYRKYIKWQNNLKKEVAKEGSGQVQTVNIPTFYPTGVVPDKASQ